jgi:hypothetical protein
MRPCEKLRPYGPEIAVIILRVYQHAINKVKRTSIFTVRAHTLGRGSFEVEDVRPSAFQKS